MKKFIMTLLLLTALLSAFIISASASSFDHCADALNELGLFEGTDKGYELDKSATRAEAVTMLVRLLGKETEAKAGAYELPFTDVPAWARPYIGYAYENGLTNGSSATLFAPSAPCTSQMYATFLLRALGYDDITGSDFKYSNALSFAREKGVVDDYSLSGSAFLRDNMAAMSYTALATDMKSGEMLLDKLIADGAVKDSAALGCTVTFAAYRNIEAAFGKVCAASALQTLTQSSISGRINGADSLSAEQKVVKKYVSSPSEIYYISVDDVYTYGDTVDTASESSYYYGGKVYVRNELGKFYNSYDASTLQIGPAIDPLCTVASIDTRIVSDGGTMYTVNYGDGITPMQAASGSQIFSGLGDATIGDFICSVVLKSDMSFDNQSIYLSATVKKGSVVYDVTLDSTVTVEASGAAVELSLPADLSEYKQVVG